MIAPNSRRSDADLRFMIRQTPQTDDEAGAWARSVWSSYNN
jgi:hypothetical protein